MSPQETFDLRLNNQRCKATESRKKLTVLEIIVRKGHIKIKSSSSQRYGASFRLTSAFSLEHFK